MLLIMRLLMFGILALVLWKVAVLVLQQRKKSNYELKCVTCRHCELVDRDGVMCRYGDLVTLKTLANVKMCMDYEVDTARLGRQGRNSKRG
jgi:hypothetical protein